MKIFKNIQELQSYLGSIKKNNKTIALVPTMGNLHQGHLSLVEQAKQKADFVAVSVFVNPTQFGINEDFDKYPRTFDEDIKKLKQISCDMVFAPSVDEMYTAQFVNTDVFVDEAIKSKNLCGKFRKEHFKGVLTVVSKLFNIFNPEYAFFGLKDYQQYFLIKQMVKTLNFNIEIIPCEIFRETSGLAMSSRNNYLDEEQKNKALILYKTLQKIKTEYLQNKITSVKILKQIGLSIIMPVLELQYLDFLDKNSLTPIDNIKNGTLVAVSAYSGDTRLIDNIVL